MNNGKAKIEKITNGLNIVIPSKKNWFALIFGTMWMSAWFLGFIFVAGMLLSDGFAIGASGFLIFWLLMWTVAGLAVISVLLWGYFGKERFLTERNQILFEKTVFGIGKKNKLEKAELKNFRTEIGNDSWFGSNRWAFWGLGPGKIKFDYGFKTYSFGLGVDEAEANYIVKILKEQFENKSSNSL